MNSMSQIQFLGEVVCISLKTVMNTSLRLLALSKIVGKTELFSFCKTTDLGEGLILNSKPDECCPGESVTR